VAIAHGLSSPPVMYPFIRRLFFLFDAETAHGMAMGLLRFFCAVPFIQKGIKRFFAVEDVALQQHVFGLQFKNGVGLGAGFDKNARYLRELEALGFGFVEIGTVTPKPQAGNDKPRLFRLVRDKALINRMGFNNEGVAAVVERLKEWQQNHHSQPANARLLIGGNIGKNKVTPNEEAWKDYEICFEALHPYVDFFVVNVSSPNTPGLRALQEKDALQKILTHLQNLNKEKAVQKPILLKVAPDLTLTQVDDVLELAEEIALDGLVATNTTISREGLQTSEAELEKIGAGGLSGLPLFTASTNMVAYMHEKSGGRIPIIGSGGLFTAAQVAQKIAAGATLIEVWTGFIYEGPSIVKNICKGLLQDRKN
jgi:dihydroorotate dehydrogenase